MWPNRFDIEIYIPTFSTTVLLKWRDIQLTKSIVPINYLLLMHYKRLYGLYQLFIVFKKCFHLVLPFDFLGFHLIVLVDYRFYFLDYKSGDLRFRSPRIKIINGIEACFIWHKSMSIHSYRHDIIINHRITYHQMAAIPK